MKNLLKSLFAMTLVLGFLSAASINVSAQCDAGAVGKLITQLAKECNKEGEPNALNCVGKTATLSKVVRTLNSLTGNGSLTIGPRYIEYGKNQNGTVQAPGDRTFVGGAPQEKDGASISITHLDGKATLDVTVCKINAAGKPTKLDSFTLDGGNLRDGQVITKSYSGLKGQFLQVFLNGKGVLKKFQLTFKAVQK